MHDFTDTKSHCTCLTLSRQGPRLILKKSLPSASVSGLLTKHFLAKVVFDCTSLVNKDFLIIIWEKSWLVKEYHSPKTNRETEGWEVSLKRATKWCISLPVLVFLTNESFIELRWITRNLRLTAIHRGPLAHPWQLPEGDDQWVL